MSSDEISLHDGLNVFHDDPIRAFNCGPTTTPRPGPKTRDPTGFIDDRIFSFPPLQPAGFRSSSFFAAANAAANTSTDRRRSPIHHHINWRSSPGGGSTNSGDDDLDGDDIDDEEDDDLDGGEINININNNNSRNEIVYNAGSGNSEKMRNGKSKHNSFVGRSCRELIVKEGALTVTDVTDPDGDNVYYSQYSHDGEVSASIAAGGANVQKEIVAANGGGGGGGCGFSGGKDISSFESGDPLRAILSDPLTGALMDDAMILPCGHSFGAAGIQHVLRMKVCYTCSQSVSESSVAPNLSVRAAVQAFRREEELQFYRSPKRRKERFDQDKSSRGVQFPFVVADRVIIKGNKRTPPRFVGREAVVTTQCLNGWYVVKTLDNAESVKLQYRSLAKAPDNTSLKPISSTMGPNWLSTYNGGK